MERRRFRETIGRLGALIEVKRAKLQNPNSKVQARTKYQNSNGSSTLGQSSYRSSGIPIQRLHEDPPASGPGKRPFDLDERTAKFGEAVVRFCKKIPVNPTNSRLIGQLVGCGTSIGANYCEASERVSKKDFRNIIGRCAKEAKETRFFLRMIAASEPGLAHQGRVLYREARELHLIFASIYRG